MMSLHASAKSTFERYRRFIPDWDAFLEACERRQPADIRVNPVVRSIDEVISDLEADGFRLEHISWNADLLRVTHEPYPIGKSLAHWAGHIYVQEHAASVPAYALDVRRGNQVLDLCAAPGGKTTILAEAAGGRSMVLANERSASRLGVLMANIYRMRALNVTGMLGDGRDISGEFAFDRVLVDAPCSGEGNVRRSGRASETVSDGWRGQLSGLQRQLLMRGMKLTKPGGYLVYSTCTFAPEENEMVVDACLNERTDFEVVPAGQELPRRHGGLTAWNTRRFADSLRDAVRIYPHDLDSGGMFLALLRRKGYIQENKAACGRFVPGDEEAEAIVRKSIIERFRLPEEVFAQMSFYLINRDVWISTLPDRLVHAGVKGTGVRLLRNTGRYWKPTSFGMALFGGRATANRVELDRPGIYRLLSGETLVPHEVNEVTPIEKGYIILQYRGEIPGCGFFDGERFSSMLSRGRARIIRECVKEEPGAL